MRNHEIERDSGRVLTGRQILVVLVSLLVLLIVLAGFYLQQRNREWQIRAQQMKHRIDLAQEIIARDLQRVQADLLFVSGLELTSRFDPESAESKQLVQKCFADFMKTQQAYEQVRLIDRNGQELVRVDWDGGAIDIVEDQLLQDKKDRYYVAESLKLEPGQIFTSDFDLNQERGAVEIPHKPVIRFVTPVSDDNGQSAEHLLVFNYNGSELLAELGSISLPGKTFVMRQDGHFLLGPERTSEWGWLLGHQRDFENCFQDFAERIGEPVAGIALSSGAGGFYFGPFIAIDSVDDRLVSDLANLTLVAHVPASELFAASSQLLNRLILLGGVMFIPVVFLTRLWAVANERRHDQNLKIAKSEARLRELSGRLVHLQEDERRAVSREIHDQLGQQATAINLDLKLLRPEMADNQTGAKQLERAITETDQLLATLHDFAKRVRPVELDDLGLREALQSHIWDFEFRTSIPCQFDWMAEGRSFSRVVEENIFRLVQESLNNITRHAGAKKAAVELSFDSDDSNVLLRISDDGIGIDNNGDDPQGSNGSASRRLGILGMRERVELLNGNFDIQNGQSGGTCIQVVIPVSADQSGESTDSSYLKS